MMRKLVVVTVVFAVSFATTYNCPYSSPLGGSSVSDVIVVPLNSNVINKWLPQDVILAPELHGMTDIPIIFTFTLQAGVCNNAPDKSWLDGRYFDLTYYEFAMTVPSVTFQHKKPGRSNGPFTFMPRAYLGHVPFYDAKSVDPVDYTWAMVIGWDYGVDKARSHITHNPGTWSILDFDTKEKTLSLIAENTTDWVPMASLASDSLAHLVATSLSKPLLGNAQGPPGTGSEFFMCADCNISWTDADVQPLKGTLGVHRQYLPGLGLFNYSFDANHGFRLRTTWTMSMQNNCSDGSNSTASSAALIKLGEAMPPMVQPQVPPLGFSSSTVPPKPSSQKRINECSHPPGAGGGGGTYLADFVIHELKTKIVEEMLPEGIELSLAMRLLPTVPVIFVFGLQYGVCNNAEDKSWLDGRFFDLTYNEFIMGIPEVTFTNPRNGQTKGPFTYQPRLYLNDSVAMALGWGFGIDKVLAHFTHDHDTGKWAIHDWDNPDELILSLESKNISNWMPFSSLPSDSIARLLLTGIDTPILGLSGRGYKGVGAKGEGFFVCGDFDWKFFDHAEVQLIHGKMGVHKSFDNTHAMPLFNSSFLAGARVRTNWSMSFPNDCSNANSPLSTSAWIKLRDTLFTSEHPSVTKISEKMKPLKAVQAEDNPKEASSPSKKKPKKIAVLGTGLGAMSSVFYMTNYTDWQQDWDIDVYQLGWRIGGKGASGRTMNKESGYRILEHGLHFFFSFYRNVFQLVVDLFRAWKRPPNHPFQKWEDAFKPGCNNDMWVHMNDTAQPTPWAIINQVDPAHGWMCAHRMPNVEMKGAPTPWALFKKLLRVIEAKTRMRWAGLVRSVLDALAACNNTPPMGNHQKQLLTSLRKLQEQIRADVFLDTNDWPPKGWCNAGNSTLPATEEACKVFFRRASVMEIAIAVGVVADDLFIRGFDVVNDVSLDEWLCRHGDLCNGTKSGLRRDDLIRGLFDGVFGYANGRMSTPNFAAGNFLQNALQALAPPGPVDDELAVTMRMMAGMGEVIFTPMYEILKSRGVRFHFFHKVEALHTSDGETIDSIDINVQATVTAGSTAYNPLFDVDGLSVWPDLSTPSKCDGCEKFFNQLKEKDAIQKGNVNLESFFSDWPGVATKRLQLGTDFDIVLNGITSGALPYVSQNLIAKNKAWRNFLETTKTVATISLQVWTYNTTEELGYVIPNIDPNNLPRTEVMAAGGPEPYDTWADMTHLLKYETSNASATDGVPRSCQYLVSPIDYNASAANLSDTTVPARQYERAFTAGVKWLESNTFQILPKWANRLYESMVAPPDIKGRDRLRHQYWRTNIEPPELYVLSTAGSIKYRPFPWPYRVNHKVHPFKNMATAGDHTRNGLNLGCAEAAVTSGMMAAYGLTDRHSPNKFCDYEHVFHPLYPDRYPLVEAVKH